MESGLRSTVFVFATASFAAASVLLQVRRVFVSIKHEIGTILFLDIFDSSAKDLQDYNTRVEDYLHYMQDDTAAKTKVYRG